VSHASSYWGSLFFACFIFITQGRKYIWEPRGRYVIYCLGLFYWWVGYGVLGLS